MWGQKSGVPDGTLEGLKNLSILSRYLMGKVRITASDSVLWVDFQNFYIVSLKMKTLKIVL